MSTYGNGVSKINISRLVNFHKQHGKIATLTAMLVEQHFCMLDITEDRAVTIFRERHNTDGRGINAGYMVLEQYMKVLFHELFTINST